MKKMTVVFSVFFLIFIVTWMVSDKTPVERPESYANGMMENNTWWNIPPDISAVDDSWKLDPEIPDNYVPVPGSSELYMAEENGNIKAYYKRDKQEDGSWTWTEVNPDIPGDYEPVSGLKDVYKLTGEDGSVTFRKYVRNEDDTFAFVEVDKDGNYINDSISGDAVPDNYELLADNVYAVKDAQGVTYAYRKRSVKGKGKYSWEYVSKPQTLSPQENEKEHIPSQSTNPDGTYSETETVYTNEKKNGWNIRYKTIVIRTYDSEGVLVRTKKDGPTEISKTAC